MAQNQKQNQGCQQGDQGGQGGQLQGGQQGDQGGQQGGGVRRPDQQHQDPSRRGGPPNDQQNSQR